jgi:ribosomal protein S18 acetylase RimI-like enzyme
VKIELRDYLQEDFDRLYEIDQACYEPAVAYSRRELRDYLHFPGAACVVAELDGNIVGFCLTARDGARSHIITIDVLEASRRIGIGAQLLANVENELARNGVCEVGLETATDNETAIAFWKKHGYRTLGVWKGYYPGGGDAYAMSKALAPSKQAKKGN